MARHSHCRSGCSPPTVFLVLLGLFVPALSAPAAETPVPAWLAGEPDLALRDDRCRLYDWIMRDADRQTGGFAGHNSLARKRLINLANKLADRHRDAPAGEYAADLRYLVIGAEQPAHYQFRMERRELEALLRDGSCG